jgi:hypothetical protein
MLPFMVTVTENDIKAAERGDCWQCPIALAVRRALRLPIDTDGESVSVSSDIYFRVGGRGYEVPHTPQTWKFAQDFDAGYNVRPFSFAVDPGEGTVL